MPSTLIREEDALEVLGIFDALSKDKQPEASEFLAKYKHQQEHELGVPLFPKLEERQRNETKDFYALFADVKKADQLNPFLGMASSYMEDADYARKHEVGIQFLKRRYPQEPEERIRNNPELYRADYAYQVWDEHGVMDADAFFDFAKKEVDEEQTVNHALSEAGKAGRRAGIEGPAIRLQALREWDVQAKGLAGYTPAARDEFLREYDATREALRPHRWWMEGALRGMQRVEKGEETTAEDRDAFNEAAWALAEMPPKQRKAVFLKMMSTAEHLGEGARRGVGGTFTGSASRLFEQMFGDEAVTAWRGELYLSKVDLAQPQRAARYLAGPKEAQNFLLDSMHREYLARFGPRGLDAVPADSMAHGEPRLLDVNEQKLAEGARKEIERRFQVGRELKSVAYATDPFDESIWGKMAEGTGSSAGLGLTLMLGPVGMVLGGVGYRNIEYNELRRKYPNITPEQADELAMISGAAQAFLDKVGAKGLASAPSLMKLLTGQGTKELAVRAGWQTARVFALENGVEFFQDYSTPAVQHLANLMSRDMPQVDWQMEMRGFWRSRGDVALGMIPLTLLGVGAASVQDFATAREMLSQHEELAQAGLLEGDRVRIIDHAVHGRMKEAEVALRDAWGRRSAEVAAEHQDKALAQVREMEQAMEEATRRGWMPRIERTDAGYTVTDHHGTRVMADTREEALRLALQHVSDLEASRLAAMTDEGDTVAQREKAPIMQKGVSVEDVTEFQRRMSATPIGRLVLQGALFVPNRSSLDGKEGRPGQNDYSAEEWERMEHAEGFHDPRKNGLSAAVFLNQVEVRRGETPLDAIGRVLSHERVGHKEFSELLKAEPKLAERWELLARHIPSEQLKGLRTRYDFLEEHSEALALEWMADRAGVLDSRKHLHPGSLLHQMWQVVSDVFRRMLEPLRMNPAEQMTEKALDAHVRAFLRGIRKRMLRGAAGGGASVDGDGSSSTLSSEEAVTTENGLSEETERTGVVFGLPLQSPIKGGPQPALAALHTPRDNLTAAELAAESDRQYFGKVLEAKSYLKELWEDLKTWKDQTEAGKHWLQKQSEVVDKFFGKLADVIVADTKVDYFTRKPVAPEDRIFLVMPSGSGKNHLPQLLAERLKRAKLGKMIKIDSFAERVNAEGETVEAKKQEGYVAKMAMPEFKTLQTQNPDQWVQILKGKHLILVDDIVTTGEGIESVRMYLRKLDPSLDLAGVAALAVHDPTTVTTMQDVTVLANALIKELQGRKDLGELATFVENPVLMKQLIRETHGRSRQTLLERAEKQAANKSKKSDFVPDPNAAKKVLETLVERNKLLKNQ